MYHATTRCRELDYHDCGHTALGQPVNTVFVNHEARTSAQLLLDYHPFGRPDRADAWLAPQRLSAALVSSYGVEAEDRRLIEGIGLSYTLAAVDAFRHHSALTLEVGAVWLPDVHVLRPEEHVGHASNTPAPTEQQPMTAAMATVSLAF